MPFSKTTLVDLCSEFGRDELIQQADLETVIVDLRQMPGERKNPAKIFELLKKPTEFGRVNVINGGLPNQGFTSDGATRRAPQQGTPVAGKYSYAILEGDIEFNEGTTRVVRGGDGIDAAMEQIRQAGMSAGRITERALINHELATGEAVEAIGSNVVCEVDDISGFRPGMICDIYASDGTTVRQLDAAITTITDDGDGTGSVTISSLAANLSIGDRYFLAGSGGGAAPSGTNRCINIADISNQSNAMYSGVTITDQPPGTLDSTTSAWSNPAGERMMNRVFVKCSDKPTHLLVHPFQRQKIFEGQNPTLMFRPSDTLDVYGSRMLFDGAEVVVSNNQKPKRVDFINAKALSAQVHEFWEWSPTTDGGKSSGGWNREAMQLSQNRHSWIIFTSMGLNMRVPRRNAFGAMTNLNAAF